MVGDTNTNKGNAKNDCKINFHAIDSRTVYKSIHYTNPINAEITLAIVKINIPVKNLMLISISRISFWYVP